MNTVRTSTKRKYNKAAKTSHRAKKTKTDLKKKKKHNRVLTANSREQDQ